MKHLLLLLAAKLALYVPAISQDNNQKPYYLQQVSIKGEQFNSKRYIQNISGLYAGNYLTLPSDESAEVIRRLWASKLFEDVEMNVDSVGMDSIKVELVVKELPRLSTIRMEGLKKAWDKEVKELLSIRAGSMLTKSKLKEIERVIRNYLVEKGYYLAEVELITAPDPVLRQSHSLDIVVKPGKKLKIEEIVLEGNSEESDKILKRKMKSIKDKNWQFWRNRKFTPKALEEAKSALIAHYLDKGMLDAQVEMDTVLVLDESRLKVVLKLVEGKPYFIRDIYWVGNVVHNKEILNARLGIKKGDLYRPDYFEQRLQADPMGGDVASLYLDHGYLFFRVNTNLLQIDGDSVDLELQVQEGGPTPIRNINIEGNWKTSDHVILREMRTIPGNVFSRADLIRSQRALGTLGFFDPYETEIIPVPDPESGTVDLTYKVTEKSSDQFQLQAGWTGRNVSTDGSVLSGGLVGTLQLAFNNFSVKRMFDPRAWKPVPSGDGQKLSIAFQSNGQSYRNYTFSFQEPWLGGSKPQSLGFSVSNRFFQGTADTAGNRFLMRIFATGLDYSTRLSWPDDYWRATTSLNYSYYDLTNPGDFFNGFEDENRAFVNRFTISQNFTRSSIDNAIFPTQGSVISIGGEFTPPYSLFGGEKDYSEMSAGDKYNLLEYYKLKFKASWFQKLGNKLVLNLQADAGFLGAYNNTLGVPPFERYNLGGSGLNAGGNLNGTEFVPLRGYSEGSLNNGGAYYPIYNRFFAELRYPINIDPSIPLWVLGFVEGGNGYQDFQHFNPLDLRKSAGFGLRIQLPMVGLIGVDWGYGFDNDEDGTLSGSQFHFVIGQRF